MAGPLPRANGMIVKTRTNNVPANTRLGRVRLRGYAPRTYADRQIGTATELSGLVVVKVS